MSQTEAKVTRIPNCDICKVVHDNLAPTLELDSVPAVYDASVFVQGRWTWAFVCEEHFKSGRGRLGLGRGQKLILATD